MKRASKRKKEGTSYWQSYSDMMAALLLMFVLIMAFTILQSLRHYQEMTDNVLQTKAEYEAQQAELTVQAQQLNEQQELLDEQQATLNQQQEILNQQKDLLKQQQEIMLEQQRELDDIIGIKANIVRALNEEFSGTDMRIKVDQQTGAIILDSSILFDFNEYRLKDDAKDFLCNFLPRYCNVLMSDRFREYISEIIIEGYTDNSGTYIYNLDLSQKRAFAIAEYCLDERNHLFDEATLDVIKRLLTANGKSSNNPKYDADGNIDPAASRRVEIKFRLSDEEMIFRLQEILQNGEYTDAEMWERINSLFLDDEHIGL